VQTPNDARPDQPVVKTLHTQLVDQLRASGVLTDAEVERAMRTVPRHLFVPRVAPQQAYTDTAIPTRFEGDMPISSASQPAIVAFMLHQLRIAPGMKVLEIGAGTGYNAALLAELVGPDGSVTTLDIDDDIVDEAREHLAAAGYSRVEAITADGAFGWPNGAPYDRIMLTVGASDITPAWLAQLAEDGLLVAPLWLGGIEASVAFRKRDGVLYSEALAPCGFMRLRGAEAGPERLVAVTGDRALFADGAVAIGASVSALLEQRPRRRIWARPTSALPQFLQYLGMRGHHIVTLYGNAEAARRSRRVRMRYGLYAIGEDGPSLVLFSRLPMLLVFGGTAAERILEDKAARWSATAQTPIERAHIVARPLDTVAHVPVPEGAIRTSRRHFAFDITL
jgi:methyltransferase of FxLD system